MTGVKYDAGKPRIDLVPPSAIIAAAQVFTYGAEKYGERKWENGIAVSRLYAAAQRHLLAYWGGEDTDDDSGLPHIDHALVNLCMIIGLREKPECDDRRALKNDFSDS
jgi:hypothetical protein